MSGIILQLVTVFLMFDGNPQNLSDPTFMDYGCRASVIVRTGKGGSFPVVCTVWYDAGAGRESEYYIEVPNPRPGQVLMGCAFGFDRSRNRSECVAPDFDQGIEKREAGGRAAWGEPDTPKVLETNRGEDAIRELEQLETRRPGAIRRPTKRR